MRRARRIVFVLELDINYSGVRSGDGGIVLAEIKPGKSVGARLVFPERRRTHELARLVLDNELKAVAALTDRNIVLVAVFRIGGVGRGKVGIHISAGIGSGKLAAYVARKRGIQRVGNGKVGLLASCDSLGISFCVDNNDVEGLVVYVLDPYYRRGIKRNRFALVDCVFARQLVCTVRVGKDGEFVCFADKYVNARNADRRPAVFVRFGRERNFYFADIHSVIIAVLENGRFH